MCFHNGGEVERRRRKARMGESTSVSWVVLVINVNISLVGLILLSSIFQKVQQWSGMDKRMWNPFKMLRTKDWLKLQAQDSSFYILVIQDHIESIGKANTIKRG